MEEQRQHLAARSSRSLRGLEAYERSNMTLRQFRFWMLQSAHPGMPIERFLRVNHLPPHLARHLEDAWRWFSEAADATRARWVEEDGTPRLIFEANAEPLEHHDLPAIDDPAEAVFEWVERTQWTRFDPGDLLCRHAILKMHDGRLLWASTAYHLASDGRSDGISFRFMVDALFRLARGELLQALKLPSFELNMAEERLKERGRVFMPDGVASDAGDDREEKRGEPRAPFSVFGVQGTSKSTRRPWGRQMFSGDFMTQLSALCGSPAWFHRSVEATLSNLFVALVAVWVWRHGGPREMVIGVPFHGRSAEERELIGFKSETLPVHVLVKPEQSFAHFLQEVHAEVRNSLQRRGQSVHNPLHAPVFWVFVGNSYVSSPSRPHDDDLARVRVEKPSGTPELVRLTIDNNDDASGGMNLVIRVPEEIEELTHMDGVAAGFHTAITTLMDDPAILIERLHFRDQITTSKVAALQEVHLQTLDYRWISAWVARLPTIGEQPALVHGDVHITHAGLAASAGRWRSYFKTKGLVKGDRVVVWAPTSHELTAAWLALMSIGGVYIPVHHATSAERLAALVHSTNARWLLHTPGVDLPTTAPQVRRCALSMAEVEGFSADVLDDPDPDAIAHIFHTSGSTGVAKPIAVSHRALAASIHSWIDANGMREGERIFHFYATTFDPWLTGILPALWLAGTCITRSSMNPPSAQQLVTILETNQVSSLCTPTAYFHALCDVSLPRHLRRWIVGGEALAADKAMRFLNTRESGSSTRLINAYGPTETTIWVSVLEIKPEHAPAVPIGRPFPTCGFRIVDEAGNVVPFGVTGELWITGPQLADGYDGQPELTAQQFVIRDDMRWYRTGDNVRLRRDGDLDFLGRLDRQVQIKGYRVEPGEIEVALRALAGVNDAVVVPIASALTTSLCAYVMQAPEVEVLDPQALRLALLRTLPEYKVPRWFVLVDAIPFSGNGKIDLAALPKPQMGDAPTIKDRLPTLTLWDLRFAFEEVLDLPSVGVDEDFFELGGDSLLLVELIAAIERRFGKTLEPVDVIEHPTIGGLAPLLETGRVRQGSLLVELNKGSHTPLFCIPGAGGIGVEFYAIARRLPKDQPVIVLRSSGTDGHSRPPHSAQALLDEHEAHLLAWREQHGDTRPVMLVGYSLGGIFAYELARRLQKQGIPIKRVFLIDAHIATEAGRALRPAPKRGVRERVKTLFKGSARDQEVATLERELTESIANGRIMDAARLGRLNLLSQAKLANGLQNERADFPVTYFLAANGPRREHAMLWKELVSDMTLVVIEGSHDGDGSIVREPNVAGLAKVLQQQVLQEQLPQEQLPQEQR